MEGCLLDKNLVELGTFYVHNINSKLCVLKCGSMRSTEVNRRDFGQIGSINEKPD